MNRESIEALNLVLATLNLDDVYPAQRELLREAIAAATKSQEQITSLTALCEIQHELHTTAVDMLKPAIEAATIKEREACAKVCETLGVHPALSVYAGGPDWYKHGKDIAAAIRARGQP